MVIPEKVFRNRFKDGVCPKCKKEVYDLIPSKYLIDSEVQIRIDKINFLLSQIKELINKGV